MQYDKLTADQITRAFRAVGLPHATQSGDLYNLVRGNRLHEVFGSLMSVAAPHERDAKRNAFIRALLTADEADKLSPAFEKAYREAKPTFPIVTADQAGLELSQAAEHARRALAKLAYAIDESNAHTERADRAGREFLLACEDAFTDFPELVLKRLQEERG